MAQIILSEAGAALGRTLLPQGLSVLGRSLTGAALGRAAGGLAGQVIDGYFAAPAQGPRVKALHVMGAAEGDGVASVYGRMRVGGELIWASRFKEIRTTERAGKGGPRIEHSRYSVSLAVALGEGPVARIVRAWANGEPFDLSGVLHRMYPGTEEQEADPLIEMIEDAAPAYRGLAYLVFEDLPLEQFGNRLPQLSFEVLRAPGDPDAASLGAVVTGVNIIPASGEFVYATSIVRDVVRPGVEKALNVHSGEMRADFLVSLDQLRSDLPRLAHVALTCGWFGSSIAAESCLIRPGVETRTRVTRPLDWSVAGETRADAYLVSQDGSGRPNYGGTPSDASMIEAIRELKTRGYLVTLTPFLFVDATEFPWRGRITVGADGTTSARDEIDAFVHREEGYRRFILHHAQLAAEAGGVEAFLIGSEMRGLTRVRDETGAFPFVEALCGLAEEVKALLPGAKVSYAADWTEYGAYVPGDESGDVLFPLDALWAHPDVDFVGIDWYPPMGDWRGGAEHADATGFAAADDPDYLASQIEGGEAFDWYYADDAARDAQIRTPIIDTAHGENWVFRAKDIAGWSGAPHYPRPDGVRAGLPTGWTPNAKPIRLSEIGFAAVDMAGNAPNLFFDPKSSESGLPPYSTGARDDVMQARLLASVLPHFETSDAVDSVHVWAWDARPFPAWPLREEVWGDGANWSRGHWLNGRTGAAPLAQVVADICAAGGVEDVDTGALDGLVEGYVLEGVSSVRAALEPLATAFGFEAVERSGGLVFRMTDDTGVIAIPDAFLGESGIVRTRQLMDKAPERLRLACIDPDKDYGPMVAEARRGEGDARLVADVSLPLAPSRPRADALAAHLLGQAARTGSADVSAGPALAALEAGDRISLADASEWQVVSITDEGATRRLMLAEAATTLDRLRAVEPGGAASDAAVFPEIDLVVMDAAGLSGLAGDGPLVAAFSDPWPGEVAVLAGVSPDGLSVRARLERPAVIGRLAAPVEAGPLGRWDHAARIEVSGLADALVSLSEEALLAGGNAALLETETGWELIQFRSAELTGPGAWRLTGLLRGQDGTPSGAAAIGARFVLLDGAVRRGEVAPMEAGVDLLWRGQGSADAQVVRFERREALPWQPCHLRVRAGQASWLRRGRDIADSWTFPEAPNVGRFAVEFDLGAGFVGWIETSEAACDVPSGTLALRVAEIGPDGRTGEWLSIGPGSPYL
ncbi:MAG: glycoside hydrolase/phage tail family protein [Hyphomonas sp.]